MTIPSGKIVPAFNWDAKLAKSMRYIGFSD
jgi:hypothetical protein